jgi:flagellar biosynthesis anti-sigma factor FlgM
LGGRFASDSASLSAPSTELGAFPTVRQERVQALRQKVQSGNYKVDAGKVAQSILGDAFKPVSRS